MTPTFPWILKTRDSPIWCITAVTQYLAKASNTNHRYCLALVPKYCKLTAPA